MVFWGPPWYEYKKHIKKTSDVHFTDLAVELACTISRCLFFGVAKGGETKDIYVPYVFDYNIENSGEAKRITTLRLILSRTVPQLFVVWKKL